MKTRRHSGGSILASSLASIACHHERRAQLASSYRTHWPSERESCRPFRMRSGHPSRRCAAHFGRLESLRTLDVGGQDRGVELLLVESLHHRRQTLHLGAMQLPLLREGLSESVRSVRPWVRRIDLPHGADWTTTPRTARKTLNNCMQYTASEAKITAPSCQRHRDFNCRHCHQLHPT